ncbi:OmpP1/FadL family transporter [Gymnodinialimonas sp.]
MTRFTASTTALAALLATTTLAHAGGVERQAQSPAILFQEGTYVEFGFTYVDPDISGIQAVNAPPTAAGADSGDVAPSYSFSSLAYRQDITDSVSVALIYDQPVGADVDYQNAAYLYGLGAGSQAELRAQALTIAARYQFNENISVYGGLRAVTLEGDVRLFNGSGGGATRYQVEADTDHELGFMLGAAYERPDIALRVALTYYSATEHTFTGTETAGGVTGPSTFNSTIPQQVLLEAQSGVAEGTLVFGSVRWTDWTEFNISPPTYIAAVSAGRPLVEYNSDVWTYTLGGARVLNDTWTLLGSITYEDQVGGFAGNLGPTDGRTSFGLGARYTSGNVTITGGINYTLLGDAITQAPQPFPNGTTFANFNDNTAVGFGLRVGYTF